MTYFNWKSPDIPNLNESTHLDEHGNEWMKCMVEDLSQVIFLFSQFLHMWAPIIIPLLLAFFLSQTNLKLSCSTYVSWYMAYSM